MTPDEKRERRNAASRADYAKHREARLLRQKEQYETTPGFRERQQQISAKVYAADPKRTVERRYGLPAGSYARMHAEQGGVCAICGDIDPRRLWIDHCHKIGLKDPAAVRGLLCQGCNIALAWVEREGFVEAAAAYLARHAAILASGAI